MTRGSEMPIRVDREALCARFLSLVAQDNPSFDERAMADEVKRQLGGLGIEVLEDGAAARIQGTAGNLYARLPGVGALAKAEPIAFCAHLDSVAPACGKHAVLHPDGRITSEGDTVLGADDLSAVAAMIEIARLLRESGVAHRPLEMIFTVCEEPYTLGSRAIDQTELPLQAKKIFVPDLTGAVGTAALAAPTIMAVTVSVTGRAAHAGFAPEKGIHAIAVAARALSALTLGRVDEETTVGIGTIHGGTVSNAVPDRCELSGEIRGYDDARVREEFEKIRAAFEREAAVVGATVELTSERRTLAYAVEPDAPIVTMFQRACCRSGVSMQTVRTFGGSDANTFAAWGREVLVVANAMSEIHSTKEYTTVDELCRLGGLLLALATQA